jgi:protein-S-isoprenylcysteine O-methyltransferase Ste14
MGAALGGLVFLVLVIGAVVFGAAGTLSWVAGWVFVATFAGASLLITLWLAAKDPALLARRTQAGPTAEKDRTQRIIQSFASFAFLALLAVPGLDHRFGWSPSAPAMSFVGDALVAAGFFVVFLVFRANTFTSATIDVAEDQRVIDAGPYAVVRHPMYAGALVLLAGIPLALESIWGLVAVPPMVAVLVARLVAEERYLAAALPAYEAYRAKTRWRLVPGIF